MPAVWASVDDAGLRIYVGFDQVLFGDEDVPVTF